LPFLAIVALAINSVKGYSCTCNYPSVRTGVELKEATMSATRFKQVADSAQIDRAVAALNKHGFSAKVVATSADAKAAVLALIPAGSEVFTYYVGNTRRDRPYRSTECRSI